MKNNLFDGEQTADLIALSDVHLKECTDSRGQKLINFLKELAPSHTRRLVLLGDVFDFCFGDSDYFRKKFSPIGDLLSKLSRNGIKVYVFEGNHEFAINKLGWQDIEFCGRESKIIKTTHEHKILLAHGDLIAAPWHYKLYSSLVRSKPFLSLAKKFPQDLFDRGCLAVSKASGKRDYHNKKDHKKILRLIDNWSSSYDVDNVLVGHFHCPYNFKRKNNRGKIWGLDSWDEPNIVILKENNLIRKKL